MSKVHSLAFLVAGIILIIYGTSASESVSSGFSHLFTGDPTNQTVWVLIGGVAAAIMGAAGVLLRPRTH